MVRGMHTGARGAPAAVTEFARGIRERPLQLALLVSLVAHAALLWFFAGRGNLPDPAPVRLLQVRILPPRSGAPQRGGREAIRTPGPLPAPATSLPRPPATAAPPAVPPVEDVVRPVPEPVSAGASDAPPVPERPTAVPPATAPVTSEARGAEGLGAEEMAVAAAAGGAAPPRVDAAGETGASPPAAAVAPPGGGGDGAGPAAAEGTALAVPEASGPPESPFSSEQLASIRRRIEARKVYPRTAVRNGWEGEVLVELDLGLGGRLDEVRVVRGSGYEILDKATLVAVRRAAPYPPLEGRVTVPVEYRLIP